MICLQEFAEMPLLRGDSFLSWATDEFDLLVRFNDMALIVQLVFFID